MSDGHDEGHPSHVENDDERDEGGPVVLDIGGDVGALILHTDKSLHHVEIEISPDDESGADVFQAEHPHDHSPDAHTHEDGHTHAHTPGTTHVAVLRRRGPGGVGYAAVYPGLREGQYTLWNADHTPADTVHVVGGAVVEVDWRGR